jgi:dolichol-phosphate mannosyltransferase
MRALIVIPTYNEIDNIEPLIQAIMGATPDSVDVLVVDDGSPDGTGQLVDAIAAQNKRVHVLHRAKKMGLGTAYVNGFKWGLERGAGSAVYDVFIEMDADFSHDPKYLSRMLELLSANDVVIGSRYVSGGGTVNWGVGRKVISRGGSLYSRLILGAGIRDFTGGFNGWRRKVLESVDLDTLRSDGYSFQIELKFRACIRGFKIVEFPIIFADRKVGKSKMSKKIVFEALGRVWGFRWRAAKQGHGSIGKLISLCSGESQHSQK